MCQSHTYTLTRTYDQCGFVGRRDSDLRVDRDDFPSAASHHQHTLETFGKNLQELHICGLGCHELRMDTILTVCSILEFKWKCRSWFVDSHS